MFLRFPIPSILSEPEPSGMVGVLIAHLLAHTLLQRFVALFNPLKQPFIRRAVLLEAILDLFLDFFARVLHAGKGHIRVVLHGEFTVLLAHLLLLAVLREREGRQVRRDLWR